MNPALLRNVHLEALQHTFTLPDTAMEAIKLILDIALNQQHCEEMTDLVKLKDYLDREEALPQSALLATSDEFCYILKLEALERQVRPRSAAGLSIFFFRFLKLVVIEI